MDNKVAIIYEYLQENRPFIAEYSPGIKQFIQKEMKDGTIDSMMEYFLMNYAYVQMHKKLLFIGSLDENEKSYLINRFEKELYCQKGYEVFVY